MATEAEAEGDTAEPKAGAEPEVPSFEDEETEAAQQDEETPHFVEVWNEYDPSMRFVVIFPVGERQGAAAGSVAYYIIEPGKHTGLHSDNAEEIAFIAEGEGEVFSIGKTQRLEAGKFIVFQPGLDHDIYAQGSDAMRVLSFFPTTEILSTFQQEIFPVGGNVLSSTPPQGPRVVKLDPNNLPEDFPFSLDELGLAELANDPAAREPTMTERLLGMHEPGAKPPVIGPESVIDPNAPKE